MAHPTESVYAGRLAPSPTGLLHLGLARTFWTAFTRARAAHGKLWLRDEDLDPQRSRPEFSLAMKEDLRWLGLAWDAELRQSDRLPLYRAAMQQLLQSGLAYACACSRRDLQLATQAPHDDDAAAQEDDEPVYNGRCRPTTGSPPSVFQPGVNYRFRVPDGESIRFDDLHAGPQSFTAGCTADADFGDFLLWRKALSASPDDVGLPSYQLACVVDDAAMNITEVVRGRDLLKSTARQILLQRALGLPTPRYFHTNLMRDASGLRLAKRHDALSLRALRASGLTPDAVRLRFNSRNEKRFGPTAHLSPSEDFMTQSLTLKCALACSAATLLLFAGCKKTADNTANYKSAIDAFYSANQACLWTQPQQFPTQVAASNTDQNAPFAALVDQGLLTRTTSEKKIIIISKQEVNYDLSDKGRSAWTADPNQPGYGNFCYGHRTVQTIDSATPTNGQPGATTQVTYHYGFTGAPNWATAAETQTAFPQLQANLNGGTATATLVDTSNGWQVQTPPPSPQPASSQPVTPADGKIVQ